MMKTIEKKNNNNKSLAYIKHNYLSRPDNGNLENKPTLWIEIQQLFYI